MFGLSPLFLFDGQIGKEPDNEEQSSQKKEDKFCGESHRRALRSLEGKAGRVWKSHQVYGNAKG